LSSSGLFPDPTGGFAPVQARAPPTLAVSVCYYKIFKMTCLLPIKIFATHLPAFTTSSHPTRHLCFLSRLRTVTPLPRIPY